MNILIIDDVLTIQEYLKTIINENYPKWHADICGSYEQAVTMASENNYDLFIIDYELDTNDSSKNGIALGLFLSSMEKYRTTPIIFETSYSEHIFNAVNKLNCVYYLIKPYDTLMVTEMLKKATNYLPPETSISLKDEYGISAYIHPEDIIYVEANRHKLTLFMASSTFTCVGHSLDSLSKLCSSTLIRCHKSYLVNRQYITHIDKISWYITVKHPSYPKSYTLKLGRAYTDLLWLP